MFRKNYFSFLLTIALFLIGGTAVFAQTAPVHGQVVLKKADGSTQPVAGALVEVFRSDTDAKFPSDKTDKKGYFAFAGLPAGPKYLLSVSGLGIAPLVYPNVPAGAENFVITVSEGDGKRFTPDEVKQVVAGSLNNSSATQISEPSAEQKKAQEEEAKRLAEYESKKKKIENINATVQKAVEEGNKAFNDKNYDLAISKFDEGINADPDFAGSAPVLLNNKAVALKNRAVDNYNKLIKADAATKASGMAAVKKDFEDAIVANDRALEILKNATSTDATMQKGFNDAKFNALLNRKEVYRLMIRTGVERTKGKEAMVAFQEYLAIEPDAKKKSESQLALAEALQDSSEFDQAIVEFEKVLALDANNVDALAGIGLSLVNIGYMNDDKEKLQQGANYLQKFISIAPDNHKYKDDAVALLDSLKKEQNVAPQKNAKKKP